MAAKAAEYARTPNASRCSKAHDRSGGGLASVSLAWRALSTEARPAPLRSWVLCGRALPNKGVISILAGAMSADAATSAPTKRGRKAWLIALAVVVAVVTIVFLANAPKREPVKVWFVRATNEAGVKMLVFEGTNAFPRHIFLGAAVVTGAIHQAKRPDIYSSYDRGTNPYVAAGTNFYFTLNAPPKVIPYWVLWSSLDNPHVSTPWETLRWRCYDFLGTHGMPRLADHFAPSPNFHYIPSSEIKE